MFDLDVNLYFYTVILLIGHLAIPLGASTLGPAYVDLTFVLNTSIQNVSYIQVFISIGQILGTLLAMPLTQYLWQIFSLAFVFGIGVGVWFVSFYMWIMEIWQRRSGSVLFLAQLMLGVGFTMGPLIDKPYLTGDTTGADGVNEYDIDVDERRAKLFVPFLISGCITAICPIMLFIMFFAKRYEKPEREVNVVESPGALIDNNTATKYNHYNKSTRSRINHKRSTAKRLSLILLMTVCISTINTLELIYFVFGVTYFQYIPGLHIPAPTAAGMVSVMIICYTAGQAINFFVGLAVKTNYIVSYHYVLSFAAFVGLMFANRSATGLWVTSGAVGFAVSALFPGHMSYFERHLKITDRISSFMCPGQCPVVS
ncbi:unnamed protein product [Medioppia subpectinata]|uniref:Uncharacterized protein n=1 Tax=Medioppia subpectinata TaxID=1979941 RepID=A0A7R9Q754_9ACAR|nr:unnamed protein product [Medioppia subpectinata]CAG2115485.1 unnamed protein product [Medioppia subpectinata]